MAWKQTTRKLHSACSWCSPFVSRNTNWTDPFACFRYFILPKQARGEHFFFFNHIAICLLLSLSVFLYYLQFSVRISRSGPISLDLSSILTTWYYSQAIIWLYHLFNSVMITFYFVFCWALLLKHDLRNSPRHSSVPREWHSSQLLGALGW